MTRVVSWVKEGGIAIMTIDNPPVNAISEQVVQDMNIILDELAEDQEVRAVVVTGNGERAFVAGGNIKDFPKWIGRGAEAGKEQALLTQVPFNSLANLGKPTIAAVNGLALGGGCELALCCDIRIAEEQALFGLPEINLGLFPGAGGTQRLPRLIGEGRAKEMIFTGKSITAAEAVRIGLANEVVPSGEALIRSMELANVIAEKSFPAISRIKKAINEGLEMTLEEGLNIEAKYFGEVFQTEDVETGVEAFIQKKKAVFQHK